MFEVSEATPLRLPNAGWLPVAQLAQLELAAAGELERPERGADVGVEGAEAVEVGRAARKARAP